MFQVTFPDGERFQLRENESRVTPNVVWWIPRGSRQGFYMPEVIKSLEGKGKFFNASPTHVILTEAKAPDWIKGLEDAPYGLDPNVLIVWRPNGKKPPEVMRLSSATTDRWCDTLSPGEVVMLDGQSVALKHDELRHDDLCDVFSVSLREVRFHCRYANIEIKKDGGENKDDGGEKEDGGDVSVPETPAETPSESAPSETEQPVSAPDGPDKKLEDLKLTELKEIARDTCVEGAISQMSKKELIAKIRGEEIGE